jgi:UDP-glucose 4-epimerase
VKILVTGPTGLCGRHLVTLLTKRGHEVWGTFRPSSSPAPSGLHPIFWDLSRTDMPAQLPKVECVVHLAQSRFYRQFPARANEIFAVNTASTMQLLDWAQSTGVNRFLLVSTGSVYEPFRQPLLENIPVAPTSFYPVTKLAAELLARSYCGLMSICIARLFFVYGPGQTDRLVTNLAETIAARRPVFLAGCDDGIVLTPTYVVDTVWALCHALEEGWEGIYNVAAPWRVTMRELSEAIASCLNLEAPVFAKNPSEPAFDTTPDLARLTARLDPSSFRPIEEGLRLAFPHQARD